MKTVFAVALLVVVCGLCAADEPLMSAGVGDAVVAVVNKEVIRRSDLLERASDALDKLELSTSPSEQQKLTRQVLYATLRALIDEKLLLVEAQRLTRQNEPFAKLVDDRVDARIEDERRNAGGEAAFAEALDKQGLTRAEYRTRLRAEIMRDLVLYYFVTRDLSVSPGDLLEYYRKDLDRFQEPARVKFRQIFIRADKHENRAQAAELAQYLAGLLDKQHDFAKLAEEYSDGPRAEEGGLWDLRQGARPPPIDKLLFSLPVGEVGGPVETDTGFTIVKVEARNPARTIPFEEVQQSLEAELLRRKRLERYQRLVERLEQQNYVEIVGQDESG